MPIEQIQRWTPQAKEALLLKAAETETVADLDRLLAAHGISEEEFESWEARFREGGRPGLKAETPALGPLDREARLLALLLAISRKARPVREIGAALGYDWPATCRLLSVLKRRDNVTALPSGRKHLASQTAYAVTERGKHVLAGKVRR